MRNRLVGSAVNDERVTSDVTWASLVRWRDQAAAPLGGVINPESFAIDFNS